MKPFDIQGIELDVSRSTAFDFIADPAHLPAWTSAFASANEAHAVLRTPTGETSIELDVLASVQAGTIDWHMTFPNGSLAVAYSRVVELAPERCAFVFLLTPPPVPMEQLEGALEAQSQTLAEELGRLKAILERHG